MFDAAGRKGFQHLVIMVHRNADLPQVVRAGCAPRGLAGRLHRRQQQTDQHAENRDDNQQFDQRETRTMGARGWSTAALGCEWSEARTMGARDRGRGTGRSGEGQVQIAYCMFEITDCRYVIADCKFEIAE